MRQEISLAPLAATAAVGFCLVASILLAAEPLAAAEPTRRDAPASQRPSCTCPDAKPWPKPHFAEIPRAAEPPRALDERDAIAALEAVHVALSEVGDGAAYVWQRHHGRLGGIVKPTQSFKDAQGRICRHIEVTMTSGPLSKRTETIACRLPGGGWLIDG